MHKQALVVDDSRVARLTLNKLLSAQQFEVIEKVSAEEALDYLQNADSLPLIIFMDVTMEGMDGLTATKQLKATDKLANIPIVICTGNTSGSSDEAALAAGAQSVLTKPPQQQALDLILASVSQPSSPHNVKPKEQTQSQLEKITTAIENKLLPKLTQDSQKVAQEIFDKQLSVQLNLHTEELKRSLLEQNSAQLAQEAQHIIGPMVEQMVSQLIAEQLPQQLQQSVSELNLSQQVAEALAAGTQSWLSEQEHNLQQNMLGELNSQIEQAVANYLEQSIAAMIAPVIKLQVEEQLAQTGRDDEFDNLANRVSQLNRTIMGLAAIILVLAVLIFI